MRTASSVVGCVLLIGATGCELPAPPVTSDETPPQLHPAASLKSAIIHIHSIECGNEAWGPEFQRCEATVNGATKEDLAAATTDAADDPRITSWCFANLALNAKDRPFDDEFREAVRRRRDIHKQDPNSLPMVCEYLERHGDRSDLNWVEEAFAKMGEWNREYVKASRDKLRARLNSQEQ